MGSWADKLEKWFCAAAFAEAGEHETALEMVGMTREEARQRAGILETFTTSFAAAAFAEENCHAVAREILDSGAKGTSFTEAIGLRGVRVWYGFAPVSDDSFLATVGLQGVRVRVGVVRI